MIDKVLGKDQQANLEKCLYTTRTYSMANFEAYTQMMQSQKHIIEVDEEVFGYFLDVLPPVNMGKTIACHALNDLVIKTSFGFCEGSDYVVYFFNTITPDENSGKRRFFSVCPGEIRRGY